MPHPKKITVLVVEDEPLVRMAIVDHLTDEGFTVVEAATAHEAVELLTKQLTIQIMFTDVDMPGGMDGLRLASLVRDRWPPIQIVVTSGHRLVEIDDLPDDASFVPKPYNPDRLAITFRSLVG